jgi:hypothetical protein
VYFVRRCQWKKFVECARNFGSKKNFGHNIFEGRDELDILVCSLKCGFGICIHIFLLQHQFPGLEAFEHIQL